LAAASGLNNKEIAAKLGVCSHNRFAATRMDGLYDEPRPGAPRRIGDDEIAATIRRTLETLPDGATHWSLRTMGKATGYAPSTIHRIWSAFGLQPHRSETFKLSSDPLFVEKMRDIVGLYLAPPERAVVLRVDEKSQVQAIDRAKEYLTRARRRKRSSGRILFRVERCGSGARPRFLQHGPDGQVGFVCRAGCMKGVPKVLYHLDRLAGGGIRPPSTNAASISILLMLRSSLRLLNL
jgi:hypothetical protein